MRGWRRMCGPLLVWWLRLVADLGAEVGKWYRDLEITPGGMYALSAVRSWERRDDGVVDRCFRWYLQW